MLSRRILCSLSLLILLPSLIGAQRVRVDFYGESLCPDCTYFTTQILKPVFTDGISDVTDLRYLLGLAGESLCPFCAGFTTSVLSDAFKNGLGEIIAFRYIGWGNVQRLGGEYKCQHGPLECTMNTVLNCGQHLSKTQEQFFGFLFCIESAAGPSVESQIPGCAKAASLDLGELEKCYKGSDGKQLDEGARKDTDSLQPAHTYVPWVVVNGLPLFEQTDKLASYICVAYNGTRPQACYTPPAESSSLSSHASKKSL